MKTICPHCATEYEVVEESIGGKAECAICGKNFNIQPAPLSVMLKKPMAIPPQPSRQVYQQPTEPPPPVIQQIIVQQAPEKKRGFFSLGGCLIGIILLVIVIVALSSRDSTPASSIPNETREEKIERLKTQIAAVVQEEKEQNENRKIIISKAQFSVEKDVIGTTAIVAFDIDNQTDNTISKIGIEGILQSTGRKVPWIKDRFTYEFKGGLNPHEKQSLRLRPNMFSEWGKLENRDDYILELTIAKAWDENNADVWGDNTIVNKRKALQHDLDLLQQQ